MDGLGEKEQSQGHNRSAATQSDHNISSATDQSEQHFTKTAEKFLPKGEGKCTLMVMFAQQQRLAYHLLTVL